VAADHKQICKFADANDSQYVLVQKHVVGLAIGAIAEAKETAARPPDQAFSNVLSQSIESACK
jgi:hypothetical protein